MPSFLILCTVLSSAYLLGKELEFAASISRSGNAARLTTHMFFARMGGFAMEWHHNTTNIPIQEQSSSYAINSVSPLESPLDRRTSGL